MSCDRLYKVAFRGGYLYCILPHLFTLASMQRKSLAGKGETNGGSTGSMAAQASQLKRITYAATLFQSTTLPNFEAVSKTSKSQSTLWKQTLWHTGHTGDPSSTFLSVICHRPSLRCDPAKSGGIVRSETEHCQIWDAILLGSVQWHRFDPHPTPLSICCHFGFDKTMIFTEYPILKL